MSTETTRVLQGGPTLELLAVELSVAEGPDAGARLQLAHGAARVGTAPSCQLRLTDPTVSRLHCLFEIEDGALRLRDLGSTNGTFIAGVRVRDVELTSGAVVRVGSTSLRVEFGGAPAHVPLSSRDHFGGVIGGSVAMRRVYAVMERVAATDATVLIQGETGTGKELAARALHDASSRADGPFVAIDCGAIAESLIESELFGHTRGAFSGAVSDRKGVFEEADGGTLFFDEIGELPLALQPTLLRVLETREVRRVGANGVRAVDVRVVAATNRPLARSVNDGSFREDLYYRLAVVEVELPPLRARREDIPAIAAHFFERFAGSADAMPREIVPQLLARSWPGNVRELRNFVERTVSLGAHLPSPDAPAPPRVALEALDPLVPTNLPLKDARAAWTEQFEAVYLRSLLRRTNGNITKAAELAGVNRRFLQRMMARLALGTSED